MEESRMTRNPYGIKIEVNMQQKVILLEHSFNIWYEKSCFNIIFIYRFYFFLRVFFMPVRVWD